MVFARAQIKGFCRIFILSKYFKNELCSGRKTMSNSGSAHNDEHSGFFSSSSPACAEKDNRRVERKERIQTEKEQR